MDDQYSYHEDCKQESKSEIILKFVYLDIFICSKASLIVFASYKNVVALSGSLAEKSV